MIKKIGVIGAGMMGSEIALCFAQKGYETFLNDVNMEFVNKGIEKQRAVLDKKIVKNRLTVEEKEKTMSFIVPSDSYDDLSNCDLIIEAAPEVVEIKSNIFKKLDEVCKDSTIFASNTSTISITKLAAAVSDERKGNFIGTHFNSPASIMKLVEVIPGLLTDLEITNTMVELLTSIEKEPVKVKDVVGFALNRIFHAMTLEACRIVEEGVCSVEDVDKICKFGLGHPMGVFALLDITSHDLNLKVHEILFEAYGDRFRPSPQIKRLVDSGKLGRKTGSGFYKYNK